MQSIHENLRGSSSKQKMEGKEREGGRSNDEAVDQTKGHKNEVCLNSNSNERCSVAFLLPRRW